MAGFDDVGGAAARTDLAWSRTGWGLLTMAGTILLVGAHRRDLGFGLVGASLLALAATVVTYRQRRRDAGPPGCPDTLQIGLTAASTIVAALLALLLLVVAD